jgi:hypothetical protein
MISQNGYHYTKVADSGPKQWRLTHHIIAEEKLLKRALLPDERVVFVDKKNKLDLRVDNIKVEKRGNGSKAKRIAQLEARIAELQGQLDVLKAGDDE